MFRRARKFIALTVSSALMLSACLRLPPIETPIPTVGSRNESATGRALIVMLPGMGDRAETFATQEFLEIGRQNNFDTLSVDAHFGYYRDGSVVTRLHEDVIQPARERGYDSIWLLGISMGGYGSLLYAEAHPDEVDGLILLAPYLGGDKIISEVLAAEDLQSWSPGGGDYPDHEALVWRWLQREMAEPGGKPIVLAYGNSDRLAGAYGPLLTGIDPSHVFTRDGKHKWTTWKPLWSRIAPELSSLSAP